MFFCWLPSPARGNIENISTIDNSEQQHRNHKLFVSVISHYSPISILIHFRTLIYYCSELFVYNMKTVFVWICGLSPIHWIE